MARLSLAALLFAISAGLLSLSPPADASQLLKKKAAVVQPAAPKEPPATDPATMKVAKGFKVELLYSVPGNTQGSWVNICSDPKGRLIASDQYGSLYRITPGAAAKDTAVEKLSVKIGMAQGLLWAFDSLYVVVNGPKSGLYRVTASKNDDNLDTVQELRLFEGGGGEHGPHAVILNPDGKRLTVVCGNQTKLTKFDTTKVPPFWGEDHLLPRLPDGNGFMAGVLGPGGAIYNVSPDGKTWELWSVGFRNEYDAAYNSAGDLFTYDADMEWDFNTPWYRPTRVCLATSGSEFGWRNGAGKWPAYYPDSVPAVLNIGPGSPTGVTFGYGAKFPKKYQDAFFICDWSYGKMYAVHLAPSGSAYKAEAEEFITGTPLPLTDLCVNPKDGAMYFLIGGRKTKSGLYRVTYTGEGVNDQPRRGDGPAEEQRKTRLALEAFHGVKDPKAVEAAFKELNNADRFTQYSARAALEFQDPKLWAEKAFAEADPEKKIQALLALVRVSAPDPFHRKLADPKPDPALSDKIVHALSKIDFAKLEDEQKLDLIRAYEVLFNRFGPPTHDAADSRLTEKMMVEAQLGPALPDKNRFVNSELLQVLVFLQDKAAAVKGMKLLREAPTQEEQIEYARSLRMLKTGWTPELRNEYFSWFLKAANYRGGASFGGFLRLIKADAVKTLSPQEAKDLAKIINAQPGSVKLPEEEPRPFVKAYKLADLAPALEAGLKSGRDFDRGRKLFATAKCFGCHRFDSEGGSHGPDLSGAAGRFSARDLLESIVDPNKEISDQYAASEIRTLDDRVVVGRIVNLNNNEVHVNTNMLDPGSTVKIDRNNIDSMKTSKVSMMPAGLLDTFKEDEVLDLMAYLLSRGDRKNAMFKK
jgi:putative heme-binding domain-containing protein